MKKNKVIIALFIVVGIIGAVTFNGSGNNENSIDPFGASGTEEKAELKKLKIVYVQDVLDSDITMSFIQDKRIFFSRYNLDVEQLPVEKSSNNILLAGQADLMLSGPSSPLGAYLNDSDPVLIANVIQKFNTFGASRFPRERASSIKKAVLPEFGKEMQLITINALKDFGADPAKIEFLAVPTALGRLELLSKGEADFTLLNSENALYESGAIDKFYILEPKEVLKNNPSFLSMFTTKKALEEKPQEIKNFVFAFYEGLEYMSDNPEETLSYIKNKYKRSDERTKNVYNRFIEAKKGRSYVPTVDELKNQLDFVKKEMKPSDPDRDINGFIYADFAKEAVAGVESK